MRLTIILKGSGSLRKMKVNKSLLRLCLPVLVLKVFMYFLPIVLMIMSKMEGHFSLSSLERRTAARYYYFILMNVFLGSIMTKSVFELFYYSLHQPLTRFPRTIILAIPRKGLFFIAYVMVDGWAGIASEILRLKELVIFHLKNTFWVKTERDREKAMQPGSINLPEALPTIQLYFLLGFVYVVVTPIVLPFILVFFAFAYLVYRHQIINVYNQKYESAGAFWPHVHTRIVASMSISQLLLIGLMSSKKPAGFTLLLVVLPVLTYGFHQYCKSRFEPTFRKYPLEEAMEMDNMERTSEPNVDLRSYLADAYLHPSFHSFEDAETVEVGVDESQAQSLTYKQ